jgi:hypothetical protein
VWRRKSYFQLNIWNRLVTMLVTCFDTKNAFWSHSVCIYVYRAILGINNDYANIVILLHQPWFNFKVAGSLFFIQQDHMTRKNTVLYKWVPGTFRWLRNEAAPSTEGCKFTPTQIQCAVLDDLQGRIYLVLSHYIYLFVHDLVNSVGSNVEYIWSRGKMTGQWWIETIWKHVVVD